MSPLMYRRLSELVPEACAHLVFVWTLDHAAIENPLEAERRQINRSARAGQDQLAHPGPHRRCSLEPGAAESCRDEKPLDVRHRAHHGARVGADVVDTGMAAR